MILVRSDEEATQEVGSERKVSRGGGWTSGTTLIALRDSMRIRRRLVIRTMKDEVFIVRKAAGLVESWCSGCSEESSMVTPDEAALAGHLSARVVYRLVEAGQVHFAETREGTLLICLRSLLTNGEDGITPQQLER